MSEHIETTAGNASAMREALETILRCVEPICKYAEPDGEQPTALFAIADTVRDIVAKALAAPPRNCDRFADAEATRQAWLDDAENWDEFGSPRLELHEWLFATVAEREGAMAYKVHLDTCPFCGRGDTAQLVPHGIGIAKFFIVRCVVKRGGCGASVTGKTRRMAEAAWNRNPPDTQEEGGAK